MDSIDFSKIYSFSKLNLFDNCPKQYHFVYLDPEIAPRKKEFIKPRDYKTKGSAVHGAITLFYHLPAEKRTFENLKKCLANAWYSETDLLKAPPLGESGGFKDIEHERAVYHDSLRMLRNFFRIKDINPRLFYLPAKNIRYSFDEYKSLIQPIESNFLISGKFDRIDTTESGNLRIIDYKTSKDEKEYSQLEFYLLLAELNFNNKVETVSYYYLNSGKIKNFNTINVDKSEVMENILKKIYRISKTNEFLPKRSGLCNHCDFYGICPFFARS